MQKVKKFGILVNGQEWVKDPFIPYIVDACLLEME